MPKAIMNSASTGNTFYAISPVLMHVRDLTKKDTAVCGAEGIHWPLLFSACHEYLNLETNHTFLRCPKCEEIAKAAVVLQEAKRVALDR